MCAISKFGLEYHPKYTIFHVFLLTGEIREIDEESEYFLTIHKRQLVSIKIRYLIRDVYHFVN